MGEQSAPGHWHWRRDRLVYAPERLGHCVAHAEKNHSLDRRERGPRYAIAAGSRETRPPCAAGGEGQFCPLISNAAHDGRSQPLFCFSIVEACAPSTADLPWTLGLW